MVKHAVTLLQSNNKTNIEALKMNRIFQLKVQHNLAVQICVCVCV